MAPSKIPTDSPSSSPTAFYLGCWADNASRDLTIMLRVKEFNPADCVDHCGAIGYAYAGMQKNYAGMAVGVSFCLLYCSYYAVVAFDSRSSRYVVRVNAIVEILMGV
jgi:hypothetical protein